MVHVVQICVKDDNPFILYTIATTYGIDPISISISATARENLPWNLCVSFLWSAPSPGMASTEFSFDIHRYSNGRSWSMY